MSWFDSIFGAGNPTPTAPRPSFPTAANADDPAQKQAWLESYIKAQSDAAGARSLAQRGLINLLTGRDKTAAGEVAGVTGPADYFKMLSADPEFRSAQAGAQNAQLGAVQNQAQVGLQSGQDVNPNNIPAILPAYTAAMRASFPELGPQGASPQAPQPVAPQLGPQPAPQSQDAAPANVPAILQSADALRNLAMPTPAPSPSPGFSNVPGMLGGTPDAAPNAAPAGVPLAAPTAQVAPAQAAALQKHRALLDLYARLDLFKGNATGAKALYDEAARGIPAGAAVDGRGNVVEGAQGGSLGGLTGGQFEAKNAGLKSGAMKDAEVPGAQAIDNNRIAKENTAKLAQIAREAQVKPYDGIDSGTGLPTITNDLDAATKPGSVVKTNPSFPIQQEQIKALTANATEADQGINLGMRIANAANGIYTGKGADTLQDFRKLTLAAAQAAGVKVNPAFVDQASKFEQLKFAAQQLVAVASHALSPRVSQLIYAQIAAVKAGDQSSVQGLRDIITKQIMPEFLRDKAILGETNNYYKEHPMANDAATVVPGKLPLERFTVKDHPADAQPGDYFIDPQSGNLRQRPAN